jgi:hypothetical protein
MTALGWRRRISCAWRSSPDGRLGRGCTAVWAGWRAGAGCAQRVGAASREKGAEGDLPGLGERQGRFSGAAYPGIGLDGGSCAVAAGDAACGAGWGLSQTTSGGADVVEEQRVRAPAQRRGLGAEHRRLLGVARSAMRARDVRRRAARRDRPRPPARVRAARARAGAPPLRRSAQGEVCSFSAQVRRAVRRAL